MFTRKRIKTPERLIVLRWQGLSGKELTTEEGERVRVIYPGRINHGSGPDFRDAIIAISGSLVKGDVEVHVKSSDWYSHGHHNDPEYNKVILHVVEWHDRHLATLRQDGKSVPVACLLHEPGQRARHLPCFQITRRRGKRNLGKLLAIAGEERFEQKAICFQASLQQGEAGQSLFQGMMRALGYSKNMEPFEELARRVPLSLIEKMEPGESLLLKQAWLLGTAGLLPSQRLQEKFLKGKEVQGLEQIWQSVGKGIKTMKENVWHFSRVYPNNSPVRRIIAQSYILQRYYKRGLLREILQLAKETTLIAGHRGLEDGLIVFGDGYWQDHFDFDARSRTRISALLGHGKAAEIVVNVILPFAFSWAKIAAEPELGEKAVRIYVHYPKLAENEITRHMARQLCLEDMADFTACHQQGLIHVFRNYCREGRCRQCPLVN